MVPESNRAPPSAAYPDARTDRYRSQQPIPRPAGAGGSQPEKASPAPPVTSIPPAESAPEVAEYPPTAASGLRLGRFFLLAYGISWALWLPLTWWTPREVVRQVLLVSGTFGPSGAAAALIMRRRGRAGLRAELARQWKWRLPFPWWVLILLAPAAIILIAIAIAQGLEAPAGDWNDPAQLYLAIPVFLYVVVLGGPLGEEFGWRGFALPRLERRLHPTAAMILLGLIWGLWHLPLFWIEGTVQQLTPLTAFLAQTTATSVIYGWLWNTTKSLPAVVVLHAATNTTVGLLPVLPDAAHSIIPLWTTIAVASAIALALTIWTRGGLGHQVDTASAQPGP